MEPVITIVGRPNVGKSTLFNRLIGYRKAIAEDTPGVTRDRNYGSFEYRGTNFQLIDTGGFETSHNEGYVPLIKKQIHLSIEESSLIIFLLDGKEGLHPEDKEIAQSLRKYGKPVLYVINKIDSRKKEMDTIEFYTLGMDKLYIISALHGIGIGELLDAIYDITAGIKEKKHGTIQKEGKVGEPITIRVALVGRPNTGKSSITNKILGSERMIVSDTPGTTRDAIDSHILFKDKEIVLIDTAGLRKKGKISARVEAYSVARTIKTIERADVVNIIIDAEEGVSHQDEAIAHLVARRGKGICIVANKWDLLEKKLSVTEYKELITRQLPHANYAPILFTSTKTGRNIEKIIDTDIRIYKALTTRIGTARLNTFLEQTVRDVTPPRIQGKNIRIFYIYQSKILPPTFTLFSNHPGLISEHYKRYLVNSLRKAYLFEGTPIRLVFRKK